MTFQQLLYVVEISKCGSINKAANKLVLSQSGISTAVHDLEEELGIIFFKRNNRGVELTGDGKEFVSYAISLLEQKNRIENLYKGNTGYATYFSVSSQRYPFTEDAFVRLVSLTKDERFQFSVKETSMESVINDVYDHTSDLGVIYLTEDNESFILHLLDTKDLIFHALETVSSCIYVRKGHPLTQLEAISAAELKDYPYLSFEQAQGVSSDFSEECQLFMDFKPLKSIVVNNRSTALNIISHTNAYTTGSGLLVEGISDNRVVTIPLKDQSNVVLGWIAHKSERLSSQAETFLNLLKQSIADSIAFTQSQRSDLNR